MKSKMLPVAVALASLFAYAGAHADGFFPPHYHAHISLNNKATFKFKSVTDSKYKSNIKVKGHINVIGASQAVVDDKQLNHDNYVGNLDVRNSATAGANVLNGATGNIGVNVAAGNNNQQANQAAISAIARNVTAPDDDAAAPNVHVGGVTVTQSADASNKAKASGVGTVSVAQSASASNTADVTQNVNIYNNEEDRAWGTASDATINVFQDDRRNETIDMGTRNTAQVGSNALNGASGNIGVNVAAGSNNQQKNDLAVATGGDRTASAAITTGQQSFDNGGGFLEVGLLDLGNCITGPGPVTSANVVNSATVGSNVLNNASGNIGVNVAAGSGNQQVNSLAIAAVR